VVILAGHTVTANTAVSIDQLFVAAGGTLVTSGGTFTVLDGPGNDMSVNGTWQLAGATVEGPGSIIIANNGALSWTSGALGASSTLNINAGCTVTFNGGTVTLNALGTINNSGTWNMEGGNMGQAGLGTFPCVFNNLLGGVVNLNGWASNTSSWHQVTNNQGTFNKNNGSTPFTFSNAFSGKSFTNQAGGVVNVATGELLFACPTTNAGTMNALAGGAALVNTSPAGTFTHAIGGSLQGTFRQNGGNLVLEGPVSITQFQFEGGSVAGPAALTIPTGGTFNWTGGGFTGTAVLNLQNGAVATMSGTGTRAALGTINNSGTWNMQGGNLGQPSLVGGPCTFNNLPGAVVNLNGWESNTNTWHQVTNNQGVINKNNGNVPFSFSNDFSGKAFNNLSGGVLNVASGECVFRLPTTNNGSITGGPGSQVTLDGNATGGFFTNAAGGTVAPAFHVLSGNLNLEAALTLSSFTLFPSRVVNGPQPLTIGGGGTANLNGGVLSSGATLTIAVGSTVVHNSVGTLAARGTINNAGTWNMEGGNIGQPDFVGGAFAFNNLETGVVNLNGWESNTSTWHMVTVNAGTINKNNAAPFTFSNAFSGKSFTNDILGAVNVNAGTLNFDLPMPVQNGTFNVASGATMSSTVAVNYAGPAILNNGTITGPLLRYQGTSAQQLNGTGTVTSLAINNAAGVDLGGEQTVTSTLTMTNGQLRLGDNDLFVENNAAGAVAGGNASSWVVNNGTGSLHRQVNGNNYLFPVGTSSYTPLTMSLTNGPQDRFSVRVQDGVSTEYSAPGVAAGTSISSDIVDRTWVVSEEVPGGNTASITLQWNAADERSGFARTNCTVAHYSDPDWVPGAFGAAIGNGPFTRTITGLGDFRELCVADADATLNDIGTGLTEGAESGLHVHPVPANDILYIDLPEGNDTQTLMLLDAGGRELMSRSMNGGGRRSISVSDLPSGLHLLVLVDGDGRWHRKRISIAH
jgi:hypothetical protein